MSSEYDALLDQAMAEYGRRRDQSLRAQEELHALTETVTAPRQAVQVTVDGLGRLTDLKFPTHSYKTMPAPDLAKIILKTVADARERIESRAACVVAPGLPAHVNAVDFVGGRLDPKDLLPKDLADIRGSSDPWLNMEDGHE
ncbi:YbaB/EbfC family nucleoid-associated protein [Kineosporia sp. NBRC 101731]|uniref:YbaB/EbfC family nucleoid-associated protein n=1 Tax=Kineosporia sp. NBRC 101731 TaxID=3032199 RepID=UPI0024A0A0E2|nr:YbaB/EbfC family nucleoid-associated protein [Kineosporia sp. NBRC 101731]GLY31532.1 hypothetical protein Kisp02_48970 [Kineosporia sp. NBRC 101731]